MYIRRPTLDEDRLKQMQARASRIWRGELQPQISTAEDVLVLVAEVRSLREKTKFSENSLFSEANTLFPEHAALFREFSRKETVSKTEETSSWSRKLSTWWRRL